MSGKVGNMKQHVMKLTDHTINKAFYFTDYYDMIRYADKLPIGTFSYVDGIMKTNNLLVFKGVTEEYIGNRHLTFEERKRK